MATVKEIYDVLDQRAPFSTQLDFDNAGHLLGRSGAEVARLLIALDITAEVIAEAAEIGAALIVSHHPLIWGQISSVTDGDLTGRRLLALMERGISAICAHTNLDAAEGGVNTVLAERLGLHDLLPLQEEGVDAAGRPYGIGRVGLLKGGEKNLSAFAERVKRELAAPGLRMLDAGRPVQKVAVVGGAGGSMLAQVLAQGCDTFVTSELKHDQYLEARERGLNLIDAGHYATEALVCPVLAAWLREAFPSVDVHLSEQERAPLFCL